MTIPHVVPGVASSAGQNAFIDAFNALNLAQFLGVWASGVTYAAGNMTASGGGLWRSLQDGNIGHLPAVGVWWEIVIPAPAPSRGEITTASLANAFIGSDVAFTDITGLVVTPGITDDIFIECGGIVNMDDLSGTAYSANVPVQLLVQLTDELNAQQWLILDRYWHANIDGINHQKDHVTFFAKVPITPPTALKQYKLRYKINVGRAQFYGTNVVQVLTYIRAVYA